MLLRLPSASASLPRAAPRRPACRLHGIITIRLIDGMALQRAELDPTPWQLLQLQPLEVVVVLLSLKR